MEATTAGPAAAAEPNGQPNEAGQEEADPGAQWQESVDQQLSQSNDAIRQMAENFQGFQQTINERLPEPPAAPSFEDQFGEVFGDLAQTGGYLEPQHIQQMQSLMQQGVEQGIQQAIAPLQEEIGEFRQSMTSQQLQALQSRFPELQEKGAIQSLADNVVDAAIAAAPRGMPPQMIEALTENPEFVALVHLAEKAKGAARVETPAGQGQTIPQIESGAGAAPTSTAGGDEWDSFLGSRKRGSVFG